MKELLRIGAGSGWWGDRIDPARRIAQEGRLDYLCFETMAEATVSTAQVRARRDPSFPGYDTYLDARMQAVLQGCIRNKTKIISNQGWIQPQAAARRIVHWLKEFGFHGVRVAAVEGSDVSTRVLELTDRVADTGEPISSLADSLISAEAYQGVDGILEALRAGADIVVTGRVADPSLFLAPMIHEFGWDLSDWQKLGQGAGIGHLLECGAQVTGGYFADPGFKDVPMPWDLGLPIATVGRDGTAELEKLPGTGGEISLRTVKEQMFYEVHDPANYLTPDVVVDFSTACLSQIAPDRVRVASISGRPHPASLKVSLGLAEGYIGEDMFFYAGKGALRRAELAREILLKRFEMGGLKAEDIRIDFLGMNAIHGVATPQSAPEPYEVAVRVAARTKTLEEATKIGREVDAMAVSGVGHTGKRVPFGERTREVIGIRSALIPRESVRADVTFFES